MSQIETEQEHLLCEINDLNTSHERRRAIGQRLNQIGDLRPGVVVDQHTTPELLWLPVAPGGELLIKKQRFNVAPFYIAKYPITYAQYQAFVRAPDGYNNLEWWQAMPKEYQPQKLTEQNNQEWNSPRDMVSWYQSVTFAGWLDHRLNGLELPAPGGIGSALKVGQNAQVRLPLEWEWQWAAQGGEVQREFPWGVWKEGYANSREAGLGQTIAVGMYPHGAAICGAEDMSGQIYEWCQNEHVNPKIMKVNNSLNRRALRGGAYFRSTRYVACTMRGNDNPFLEGSRVGFRLVVSSPI